MKNIINKFSIVFFIFRIIAPISPILFLSLMLVMVLCGLLPTLNIVASLKLIELVMEDHTAKYEIYVVAACWGATFVLPGFLSSLNSLLSNLFSEKITLVIQQRIIYAINSIHDLKTIESPEVNTLLQEMNQQASTRPVQFIFNTIDILKGIITLISLGLVLANITWWLPFLILLPIIPVTYTSAKADIAIFSVLFSKGITIRLVKYYLSVLLSPQFAKEIRIFGLTDFFAKKHKEMYCDLQKEMHKTRLKKIIYPQIWNILYFLVVIFIIYWIVESIVNGTISISNIVGIIQSISVFALSMQWMVFGFSNTATCAYFFFKLRELESYMQSSCDLNQLKTLPSDKTIKFHNVSFAYQGENHVLKNINLEIKENENIALVGENGAGKSTLIKLLCRLYEPTKGRITMGGVDISQIDIHVWRKNIGAIFQDFGQYNITIQENVTIGNVDDMQNTPHFEKVCDDVKFKFTQFMTKESQVGKEYDGIELSGGQWQRLALARGLFSNSKLLILDEPTSALDPRIESFIFNRFINMTKNKTAIMITHRLGSIKKYNRVIVMKNGQIIEDGHHNELLALQGEYYELQQLQKSLYQNE